MKNNLRNRLHLLLHVLSRFSAYRDYLTGMIIPVSKSLSEFWFNVLFCGVADTDKVRKAVAVFELPQWLGILQHVEYEPPPREWCTSDWCPYEGLLTAEGCRKGVCVRYKVLVRTKDMRQWWVVPRKKRRDEDKGGCLKPQVAGALLELAELEKRYEVGVWYEKIKTDNWLRPYEVHCGVVVNGIRLYQPYCRTVEECVQQIILDYKQEEKSLKEPPPPDPVEELLREWPELGAFGTEWVRKWLDLRERLIEIARVMRRFPWTVEVVRKNPMNILNPYTINAFVARDGSEACLQLSTRVFCLRDGKVKEVKLELEFKQYEEYEGKMREVYRPRGLLAFTATAKEYVKVL